MLGVSAGSRAGGADDYLRVHQAGGADDLLDDLAAAAFEFVGAGSGGDEQDAVAQGLPLLELQGAIVERGREAEAVFDQGDFARAAGEKEAMLGGGQERVCLPGTLRAFRGLFGTRRRLGPARLVAGSPYGPCFPRLSDPRPALKSPTTQMAWPETSLIGMAVVL